MEPRRIVLAVVLMAAVLILTPYIFPTPTPLPGSTPVATDSLSGDAAAAPATPAAPGAALPTAGSGTVGALPDSAAAQPPAVTPIDTATIRTKTADFRTTNKGAALIGASLTQYQALSNGGRTRSGTVELALPNDKLLGFRLVVPGDTIDLAKQTFTSAQSEANGNTVVTYDAAIQGHAVSIRYSFLPDSYRVNVSATVAGVAENSYLLVDLPPGFRTSEADSTEDFNHLAYAY